VADGNWLQLADRQVDDDHVVEWLSSLSIFGLLLQQQGKGQELC
jgi:hypothetical protein